MSFNKLLIVVDTNKYQPQFILSQLDEFEYSLTKFNQIYILIDDINKLYKMSPLPKNAIFLMTQDVVVYDKRFQVIKIQYELNKEIDFKKKIIKQGYIYDWLYKKSRI